MRVEAKSLDKIDIDEEEKLNIKIKDKNKLLEYNINNEYKNIDENENNDILGINRETNTIEPNNNEKEIILTESNIPMPQTPFSVE